MGGGGHAAEGRSGGGAHYAGSVHYAAGAHYAGGGYGGARVAAAGAHAAGAARGYSGAGYGAHYAVGGRSAYGYPGRGYAHGYSTGAYWGGGYWRGGYWPRAYYGLGFDWFLPVLPLAYATYWYDGLPYYYANDVYYTWNPDYNGYTATDPPPAADPNGGDTGSAVAPVDASAPMGPGPAATAQPGADGSEQIFMYPKNGQSQQQQSADKQACQQWAASQAGAQNPGDYRRAMLACVEGRGYSAN
jgi:hypothetical protein